MTTKAAVILSERSESKDLRTEFTLALDFPAKILRLRRLSAASLTMTALVVVYLSNSTVISFVGFA